MFYKDRDKTSNTVNCSVGQITPGEAQCQIARLLLITELTQLSLAFLWTTKPCVARHILKLSRG